MQQENISTQLVTEEIKMLLHACQSAECKYFFWKYCKRQNSSNIELAGEMNIKYTYVHLHYCLSINLLKDQKSLLVFHETIIKSKATLNYITKVKKEEYLPAKRNG